MRSFKRRATIHDRSSMGCLSDQAIVARPDCMAGSGPAVRPGWAWRSVELDGTESVGICLHIRSSMRTRTTTYEVRVCRRCLVCDMDAEVWEPENTDEIGPLCSRCHAPTERVATLERRRARQGINVHAAALGRLGGLKGGPARAASLTPRRRRAIAQTAARARWGDNGPGRS